MNIDPAVMQSVVVKAIIEGLGPQQKETLIERAIASLFEKPSNASYGDKRTHLEIAFERAALEVAQRLVTEELLKPEVESRIRKVVNDAVEKALTGEGNADLVERMARALGEALRSRY